MLITIDKRTRIVSDEFNWIVQFKSKSPIKRKGKEQAYDWIHWGYFQSLRSALKRLLEHKVRILPFSDVYRILEHIDLAQIEISKSLEPHKTRLDNGSLNTGSYTEQSLH